MLTVVTAVARTTRSNLPPICRPSLVRLETGSKTRASKSFANLGSLKTSHPTCLSAFFHPLL